MGASTVKSTPLRIVVSDKGKSAINAAAAQVIKEMNEAGISADGTPFPKGKTKELTMSESGRLHRDFEAYTTRLQYKAPYAQVLQEKYNWCGIPKEGKWRDEFERRVAVILSKEVTTG